MVSGDREGLRRIIYGPDATAEERTAAEAELQKLDEAERAEVAEPPPNGPATVLDDNTVLGAVRDEGVRDDVIEGDPDDDEGPRSFWSHSIRVGWVIPIVIGSLAVGFFATAGSWESIRDSVNPTSGASKTPSAKPTVAPSSSPRLGDLAAADAWFDRPFTASDTFPNTDALEYIEINPEDVRIAINGGDEGSVWVGRAKGTLCLIIADPTEGASASSCTERDNFAKTGTTISSMGLHATWYGREVTTTPRLDPSVVGPPPPTSGPSDEYPESAFFSPSMTRAHPAEQRVRPLKVSRRWA